MSMSRILDLKIHTLCLCREMNITAVYFGGSLRTSVRSGLVSGLAHSLYCISLPSLTHLIPTFLENLQNHLYTCAPGSALPVMCLSKQSLLLSPERP